MIWARQLNRAAVETEKVKKIREMERSGKGGKRMEETPDQLPKN